MNKGGIVIIGRNEGERLRRCLASVRGCGPVVYVDSGSADGSPDLARAQGVEVIALGSSKPFTAARGRNAGFERLMEIETGVQFVQFVDGDCQIAPGWLKRAGEALEGDAKLAAVRGHLREKDRDASIYRRLCDMEWQGPIGEINSTAGIAMMRVEAFQKAGGFDESVAAGEEAELCRRLRAAGYRIMRIDAKMGVHDSGMKRFSQWWKRAVRSGRSFAQGAAMEAGVPDRRNQQAVRSAVVWGLVLPILVLGLAWPSKGLSVVMLAAYAALWWRIRRGRLVAGNKPGDASLYATFCLIAKFAQVLGIWQYIWNRRAGGWSDRVVLHQPRITLPQSAATPVDGSLADASPLRQQA